MIRRHVWHAISVAAAVLFAVIVDHVTMFDQAGWMVLTTFLTSQTTRGTPLRQGIIFGLIIILGLMFGWALLAIPLVELRFVIVGIIFVLSGYGIFLYRPLSNKEKFHIMLFAFVLVIATMAPVIKPALFTDNLIAVGLGAAIGIAINQIFFPRKLDKPFCEGVAPLLITLKEYSIVLTENLLGRSTLERLAEEKLKVEKAMLFQYSIYPEWVYETGFNPGLRSGWRFILIKVECVVEAYFSLDFLANRRGDVALLSEHLSMTMRQNEALLNILIRYFGNRELVKDHEDFKRDFTTDLTTLEETLQRIVPQHIELLDISPDYIALVGLVRDIRDLRGLLLQLVMALPS